MAAAIFLILLSFGAFTCASTDSTRIDERKDKALENYTANAYSYVMALVKEKRWAEAALANCLVQQGVKGTAGSDQNLCVGTIRIVNALTVTEQCQFMTAKRTLNDGTIIEPVLTPKECETRLTPRY